MLLIIHYRDKRGKIIILDMMEMGTCLEIEIEGILIILIIILFREMII